MVPREPYALERYILAAAGTERPKVCFIPTASGDDIAYTRNFYQTYAQLNTLPKHLSLFTRTPADLRAYLLDCDVIHVGGGNTRSMLAVWRHWGLDVILREAWERGIVLAGSSAGMLCWFACGVTDSVDDSLTVCDGLGFLSGSACPHFNGERDRRPAYHAMVADGRLPAGYAADDGVGLHFLGTDLHAVISAEKSAGAYRIDFRQGKVLEQRLETRWLLELPKNS